MTLAVLIFTAALALPGPYRPSETPQERAERLAVRYPDLYFLLPNGRCYRGYTVSGGRKSSAGPLALKRELRELRPKLAAAEKAFKADSEADAGSASKKKKKKQAKAEPDFKPAEATNIINHSDAVMLFVVQQDG